MKIHESPFNSPRLANSFLPESRKKITKAANHLGSQITVTCQSGGFFSGNFAEILLLRDNVPVPLSLIPGRGINVLAINPYDGSVIGAINFDLHYSENESHHFATFIRGLDTGSIVVLACKDDCTENINDAAIAAIEALGSTQIRNVSYRDSFCLIGEKGGLEGSAAEFHRASRLGPTERLTKTFDLSHPHGLYARSGSLVTALLPSGGWWLRRRRNDGALNRVPPGFYPKVWGLLSKVKEIRVGEACLRSDPTISVSTPEELNFALQVEHLLDNILDPAENQIAVECLVVISRLEERNPELRIRSDGFDLKELITATIERFWKKWISDQQTINHSFSPIATDPDVLQKLIESAAKSPVGPSGILNFPMGRDSGLNIQTSSTKLSGAIDEGPSDSTAKHPDLSAMKNFKLARRILFDVPQGGPDGTMSFLAATCVKMAFEVEWEANESNVI
jgi:hypothetical protein